MENKKDTISKDSQLQNEKESSGKSKEIGGYKGQEPTKYGDWQHNGRVTDF